MTQWELILKRLKKPTVIISILAEVGTILTMFHGQVDLDFVNGISLSIYTIFVILGIVNNPCSSKKGYGDDVFYCEHCKKKTMHAHVAEQMLCTKCGTPLCQCGKKAEQR